jgi:hypothetical protein
MTAFAASRPQRVRRILGNLFGAEHNSPIRTDGLVSQRRPAITLRFNTPLLLTRLCLAP